MSRSGFSDDYEEEFPGEVELASARVARSIAGKRGQAFLQRLLAEMDKMPVKALHAELFAEGDKVCALGVVAKARGVDMSTWDPEDDDTPIYAGEALNIATPMAREIIWLNDECSPRNETPSTRFDRVRTWVISNLAPPAPAERFDDGARGGTEEKR
jgi:hypothetical protein